MSDLIPTFALASAFKEGDAGVGGTADEQIRSEARADLAARTLGEIRGARFVDDGVSTALAGSLEQRSERAVAALTIADLRAILLSDRAPRWVEEHRDGLSSESIAAVVKVMSDDELASVSRRLFNALPAARGGLAIGAPGHFGSRIQPNSPGDDEEEILLSILEGLAWGCGDVIFGLNPASDDVETIIRLEALLGEVVERLDLPTRTCVLSDIVKQSAARERVAVDVGFQSLAGTSKALRGMVGLDVDGIADLAGGFAGLYFETGQGSEVTNGAAEGVDMTTLEARTYGVARAIARRHPGRWMIVNDVAGFIGPEVFRSGAQLLRTCLEDLVMAKLHGLTMGLDVCSTFHMGIAPAELRGLAAEIVTRAAPAYLMAVAGNADPMLGYLTTSFREHPALRAASGCRASTAMTERGAALGVREDGSIDVTAALYARFHKARGDRRSADDLAGEARRKLSALRAKGFELGFAADRVAAEARIEALHAQAQRAIRAEIDARVLRDASPHHLRVRSRARDRDEYLAHPSAGEEISAADVARLAKLPATARSAVQIVVSDGLNADALNENLRALLPPLRAALRAAGHPTSEVDVIVANGRVRAGYHVGAVVAAESVVHVIGERPGTGLDTLSAYLTYGRDASGAMRWSTALDHSATNAVCGIHARAKRPEDAAAEIARLVVRMFERRSSGVGL